MRFPLQIRRAALLALAATTLLAVPQTASAARCANANATAGDATEVQLKRATHCLINKERTRRGLAKVRFDKRLSGAARRHSVDMVRSRYFSHTSRSGGDIVDRLRSVGYLGAPVAWSVGENIAWGTGSAGTPRQIMRAWMNSAGHRDNILSSSFREIGLGIVKGTPTSPRGGLTYTNTFGRLG